MIKNKIILITGGAGFVGSHLIEKLVSQNEVLSIDNYFTGSIKNHIPGAKYLNCSTQDIISNKLPQKIDYIFHLGEYSRVEQSFNDYDRAIRYNLESFRKILNLARTINAKLIYSGSSTKFGDELGGRNQSPYAWSKSVNTEHLINYADWYELDFAITYFYNAYGGREISEGQYSTVIAKYLKLISNGSRSLPVHGNGTQKRNFTHIDDITSGFITVAAKGQGDGFGIGSDEAYSILDIVDMLGCTPEFTGHKKGNRYSATLKTEKTKALGWQPSKKIRDYLASYAKK